MEIEEAQEDLNRLNRYRAILTDNFGYDERDVAGMDEDQLLSMVGHEITFIAGE